MPAKIDCKHPEPDPENKSHSERCRWCGRPCRWTTQGKFVHRRGYRRIWPDPRKEKETT